MKHFNLLILLYFLTITACSPKNEQNSNFETKMEALATFEDTSTALADFGNPVTASTTRIFTFKNIGDTSGPGTATLTGSNATSFSIILQTGCATVNVGSTCTVRVNFNPSGKAIGSYTADLNIGGTPLKTLTATVAAATTGGSTTGGSTGGTTGGTTSGGSGTIEASISGVVISNPLDYGSFTGTQTSTKIITLKNTGTSSTGPHTAALSDGDFTFTLNSCSNKTLAPNGTCSVRVTFNATSKTAQDYLTDLTFGSSTFPLKATVAGSGTTTGGSTTGGSTGGTTSGGAAVISFLDGTTSITSPYSIGSTTTTSITKIITIKNTGTVSTGPHTAALSDSDITFTLNSCSSKTLAPNGSCTVRVTFNPTSKAPGEHGSTLTFGTGSIDLTATKSGAGAITYTSIYSAYSGCTVTQACQGNGIESRTLTACEQYTDGVLTNPTAPLSSCSTTALTRSCQSPPGTTTVTTGLPVGYDSRIVSCTQGQTVAQGTITDVTCSTTHFKTGTTCSPNVITYTAEYSDYGTCSVTQACEGVGTQSRTFTCRQYTNGVAGSLVDNSNCTPTALTQSCDSPPGTTTVTTGLPTGYDSQTISCSAGQSTAQGTITAVTCSSNYNQQGLSCILNQHSLSVTKTRSGGGTITSQPVGINCGGDCSFNFDYGTEVSLNQTVEIGHVFAGWTGACTGTGTCIVTVDADKAVGMNIDCAIGYHDEAGDCVEDAVVLAINPSASQTVGSQGIINFSVTGGVAPYSFSLQTDGGIGSTIGLSSGVYVAGNNLSVNLVTEKIRVTDANNDFVEVTIYVEGTVPLLVDVLNLNFSPTQWMFSLYPEGTTTASKGIILQNKGNLPVDLSTLDVTNENLIFNADLSSCNSGTLAPQEFCLVTINVDLTAFGNTTAFLDMNFSYTGAGSHSDKTRQSKLLLTASNAPANGLELVSSILDIGNVFVGTKGSNNVFIKNTGANVFNQFSYTSTNPNFTIEGTPCLGIGYPYACPVTISYSPQTVGQESATIDLYYTSAPGSVQGGNQVVHLQVVVSGEGTTLLENGSSPLSELTFTSVTGTLDHVSPATENIIFLASHTATNLNFYKYNISTTTIEWSNTVSYTGTLHKLKIVGANNSGNPAIIDVKVAMELEGTLTLPSSIGGNSSLSSQPGQRVVNVLYYRETANSSPTAFFQAAPSSITSGKYVSLADFVAALDDAGNTLPQQSRLALNSNDHLSYWARSGYALGYCSLGAYSQQGSVGRPATGTGGYVVSLETETLCSLGRYTYEFDNISSFNHVIYGLAQGAGSYLYQYPWVAGSYGGRPAIARSLVSSGNLSDVSYNSFMQQGIAGALTIEYAGSISKGAVFKQSWGGGANKIIAVNNFANSLGDVYTRGTTDLEQIHPKGAVYAGQISSGSGFSKDYIVSEVTGSSLRVNGQVINISGNRDILITNFSGGIVADNFIISGTGEETLVAAFPLGRKLGMLINCPVSTSLTFVGNSIGSCLGLKLLKFSYDGLISEPEMNISFFNPSVILGTPQDYNVSISNPYINGGSSFTVDSISLLKGVHASIVSHNCSSALSIAQSCSVVVRANPLFASYPFTNLDDKIMVTYTTASGRKKIATRDFNVLTYSVPNCPEGSTVVRINNNQPSCSCPVGQAFDVIAGACVSDNFDGNCFYIQDQTSCESNPKCEYIPEAEINKCQSKGNSCLQGISYGGSNCEVISLDGRTYGYASSRLDCGVGAHYNGGRLYGVPCSCDDPTAIYNPVLKTCTQGTLAASACSTTSRELCEYNRQCQWVYNDSLSSTATCKVRCEFLGQAQCSGNSLCQWNNNLNSCETSQSGCESLNEYECINLYTHSLFGQSTNSCIWDSNVGICNKQHDNDALKLSCEALGKKYDILSGNCVNDCENMGTEAINFGSNTMSGCVCKDWTQIVDDNNFSSNIVDCKMDTDPSFMISYSSMSSYSCTTEHTIFDQLAVTFSNNRYYFGSCQYEEYCGNMTCGTGEDQNNCPQDCGNPPMCGNLMCEQGEDDSNCYSDCGSCGDNICTMGSEDVFSCSSDCAGTCGDNYCDLSRGEDAGTCYNDCSSMAFCGDAICSPNEDANSCYSDCGICGDNICTPGHEDSGVCGADCPSAMCGNFICEDGEQGVCFDDCP